MFEFCVTCYCEKQGIVKFAPIINNKNPDCILELNGIEYLIDVVTLFGTDDYRKKKTKITDLLNYLGTIQYPISLCVNIHNIDVSKINASKIKKELIDYLKVNINEYNSLHTFKIAKHGLDGEFIITGYNKSNSVSLYLMNSPMDIYPLKSIENRIKEKLGKYKELGFPIIVAICNSSDFGADWDDVASKLYGAMRAKYDEITNEANLCLRADGILMPKGGQVQYSTLTGVLHFDLNGGIGLNNPDVKFLPNPSAKVQIELPNSYLKMIGNEYTINPAWNYGYH